MRMKTYAKYVGTVAVMAVSLVLFYLSAVSWGSLISSKEKVMFYLKQPISISDAEEAERQIEEARRNNSQGEEGKEGMPEFCIWGQKNEVNLTNESLCRNFQADAILLCGNPELLFEDCRLPRRKDSLGCLVDEAVAWELFGSLAVEGKEISYERNIYAIRKVLPGDKKIFAYQAGSQSEEDAVFDRITMQKPEGKSLGELEIAWLSRHDIEVTLLDLELLRGIAGACVLLVPLTSGICFLRYLFCQYKEQEKLIWKAAAAVLGLVAAASFFMALKPLVQIPDDYIPTKWSEFSFWPELWAWKKETIRLLWQMPKTDLDYGWIRDTGKAAGFGLLAEAAAVVLVLRRIKSSGKS